MRWIPLIAASIAPLAALHAQTSAISTNSPAAPSQISSAKATPTPSAEDVALADAMTETATKFLSFYDRRLFTLAEKMSYEPERKRAGSVKLKPQPNVSESKMKYYAGLADNFGKLVSRELVKTQVETTAYAMPDGKYVTFKYKVQYEKKANVEQTVVVKADEPQEKTIVNFYLNAK